MNPEGNREMGDQIFLVIFVELFCGEATEEFRGPSEVWEARRLHMSFGFRETCPKFNHENHMACIIDPLHFAKWRLRLTG